MDFRVTGSGKVPVDSGCSGWNVQGCVLLHSDCGGSWQGTCCSTSSTFTSHQISRVRPPATSFSLTVSVAYSGLNGIDYDEKSFTSAGVAVTVSRERHLGYTTTKFLDVNRPHLRYTAFGIPLTVGVLDMDRYKFGDVPPSMRAAGRYRFDDTYQCTSVTCELMKKS